MVRIGSIVFFDEGDDRALEVSKELFGVAGGSVSVFERDGGKIPCPQLAVVEVFPGIAETDDNDIRDSPVIDQIVIGRKNGRKVPIGVGHKQHRIKALGTARIGGRKRDVELIATTVRRGLEDAQFTAQNVRWKFRLGGD